MDEENQNKYNEEELDPPASLEERIDELDERVNGVLNAIDMVVSRLKTGDTIINVLERLAKLESQISNFQNEISMIKEWGTRMAIAASNSQTVDYRGRSSTNLNVLQDVLNEMQRRNFY